MFGIKELKKDLRYLEDQLENLQCQLIDVRNAMILKESFPKFKPEDVVVWDTRGESYRHTLEGVIIKEASPEGCVRTYWVDFGGVELTPVKESNLTLKKDYICKK